MDMRPVAMTGLLGLGAAAATQICTRGGNIALGDLRVGDAVLTRDGGYQPILAITEVAPDLNGGVYQLAAGVFGSDSEMYLCGMQPVLLSGWKISALFDRRGVLVNVAAFRDDSRVRLADRPDECFFHLQFSSAQLVCCDGLWLAMPGPDHTLPRQILRDDEQRSLADSGMFLRAGPKGQRPG